MIELILYLLESSALLTLFYLLYILVLKKETFFSLSRFFLLVILGISILSPLLSFDIHPPKSIAVKRSIEEISQFRMSYYEAMAAWEFDSRSNTISNENKNSGSIPLKTRTNWFQSALITFLVLYAIGIVFCLSRIVWTLRWIWKLIKTYPKKKIEGINLISIPHAIAPFSFLNYVFVHKETINNTSFDQIVTHERTHVKQRHSIDLIFVQLLAAFFWFNPIVWQLIKSLKTTHEYIADSKIINEGYSLVEYQTLLLRQLVSNNSYGLVHNFNLSFIKKRITMMENKKSGWSGKVKVAMTIACTILFSLIIVQCNSKIEEQVSLESEAESDFLSGINLPVLPQTGFSFNGDLNHLIKMSIAGNKLLINGKRYEVNQINSALKEFESEKQGAIILAIDRDQKMAMVRAISSELRKADRLKILYLGQSGLGDLVEMALLLPPDPKSESGRLLPTIDEEYITAHNLELLKVDAGDKSDATLQNVVYQLVQIHVKNETSNYIVSLKYDNEDSYSDYLTSLAFIQAGFDQIYQERAMEMFGKDFYDLEKEEYRAVRNGIPRAISIAE